MKITIFSCNQPRHLNLVKELSLIADKVFFISEVKTIFPGSVADFYKKSDVMQKYFLNVLKAEKRIFGEISFLPKNVRSLSIKSGDLSKIKYTQIEDALSSDLYLVFGASYIKGWLIDFLIENKAANIHMGLSPYYRGSSCNFWAVYDYNPGYVGATIHLLSKGLDSGDILFHTLPKYLDKDNVFDFTMRSAFVAQRSLIKIIKNRNFFKIKPTEQNLSSQIRYSKNNEFTDNIAKEFLERKIKFDNKDFSYPELINPIFE